jgi:hypothetical protein
VAVPGVSGTWRPGPAPALRRRSRSVSSR